MDAPGSNCSVPASCLTHPRLPPDRHHELHQNCGRAQIRVSKSLGGSCTEYGLGLAIDPSGNAYIEGQTCSSDFPVIPNAFQTTLKGSSDAFVSKLNSTGSALVYSTYLGGSSGEAGGGGGGVAIDASGNA